MRGYLQRLVESHSPDADATLVTPTLRSASPVADADQRLTLADFPDAVSNASGPESPGDGSQAGASVTLPSAQSSTPRPPRMAANAPAPAPMRAVAQPGVQRRAASAPPASSVPMANVAVPAAPPPAVRAEVASRPSAASIAPPASPPPLAAMRPVSPAYSLETRAPTAPAVPTTGRHAAPLTARLLDPPHALPTQPAPTLSEPDDVRPTPLRVPAVVTRPAPAVAVTAPEPQMRWPRIAEARPRAVEEPAVQRPRMLREDHPQTRVIVREVPSAPGPPVRNPQPPAPRAPRTAAEASVIGPLGRPERLLAQLDLRLR